MATPTNAALRARLGLDIGPFQSGLDKASGEAKGFSARLSRMTSGMRSSMLSLGAVFAGGFLGGAAVAAVSEATSRVRGLATEVAAVGDEAKRAGMSAKAFQEWKFVAEQNRIGVDALTDGFKELSLRADEFVLTGQGSAAEAFQRLGYGAEDLKKKLADPSELMLEIIGRLQKMDKAAQIRISDELFGGSAGERFVELLDQGEDGIRRTIDRANELGIVMSDELIAKAAEVDRQFNLIANTVGTALKSAIVSAAASLSDFLDGFRSFQNQRDSTLQDRQSEIMREKVAQSELLKGAPGGRNGARTRAVVAQRLRELDEEENEIIGILSSRQDSAWKPQNDTWVPPVFIPTGGKGKGKGKTGGAAAKVKPDEYAAAVASIREETRALETQSEAFQKAESAGRTYADAVEYARRRAELMTAVQKAGLKITPELEVQIETLASAYSVAAQGAEDAADRMQELQDNGERGSNAIANLFLAATEGSDMARQALAQLLAQIAQAQALKGFAALAGAGGMTGGVFGFLGSLIGSNANGTDNWRGGWTWVNERGGELMNLPNGTQIIPHDISKRMAESADGRMAVDISLNTDLFTATVTEMSGKTAAAAVAQYDRSGVRKTIANALKDPRVR